jgi:hypothetical protein
MARAGPSHVAEISKILQTTLGNRGASKGVECRNGDDRRAIARLSAMFRALPTTVLFGLEARKRGALASRSLTVCGMALSHHGLIRCGFRSAVSVFNHIKNARDFSCIARVRPHIFTLIIIGLAWGIGLSIHETVPVEVQFCAGIVVITTLALLATEWYGMPRSPSNP